ncbi:DNA topoisomerase, partial [Mycoplasmopsis bovis]|uniref:DNA topoisomerase n=1 Tax=Mycoplasmopsis bovis TaxID=28903 RepID=UPI003D2DDD88
GNVFLDSLISLTTLPALTPFKQAVLYKRSPFSSSITQASLQRLYEGFGDGGLISYPRTDSTRLSHTFVNATKNYISIKYGDEYVLDKVKGFKG